MKVLSINEDSVPVQGSPAQSKPAIELSACDDCNTESDHGCDRYSGNGLAAEVH